MRRLTIKEAQAMADKAGRGQIIAEDCRDRMTINEGLRILRPNRGESLFAYALRTIGQDIEPLVSGTDCTVFPDDDRRCDFSFLPIPLVIEIHGNVHQIVKSGNDTWSNRKQLERDCLKENEYQLRGLIILKFTPEQMRDDPYSAMEQVRRALQMQQGKSVPWYTKPEGEPCDRESSD